MGFLLSGFTVKDNVRLQNAITEANKAIGLAFQEMTRVKVTSRPTRTYVKWFGVADAARIGRVFEVMSMLNYAANASFIRYIRMIGKPDTLAAARKPRVTGWGDKTVKQMLDKREFSMKIHDGFCSPDAPKDEVIQTIVHELSHLVADTEDVPCPWDENEDCYGRADCRRLADRYPDLAIWNADNVGYYVIDVASPPVRGNQEGPLSLDTLFA